MDLKKVSSVSGYVLAAGLVMAGLLWYADTARSPQGEYTLEGRTVDVILSARLLTLEMNSGDRVSLTVPATTQIYDIKGRKTVLSLVPLGAVVKIKGSLNKEQTVFLPSEMRVLRQP